MGVNFQYEVRSKATWTSPGFNIFRRRLAREIGIVLDELVGFGGSQPWPNIKDPIFLLLNHKDCSGEISPQDCHALANRLGYLIRAWPNDYDRIQAQHLIDTLYEADKANLPVKFC
jgi:hypothetical protein